MLSGSALVRVLLLIVAAAGLIGVARPYWAVAPVPQERPAVAALASPSAPSAHRSESQPASRPPEPPSRAMPAPQRPAPPPASVTRSVAAETGSLFEATPATREAAVPPPNVQPAPPREAPADRQVASADDSVVPRTLDLVDLNTGSLAELNALKGGGAVGRAIVQHRPYGAVDQLVLKRVLSRAIYQRVKDQVTVR